MPLQTLGPGYADVLNQFTFDSHPSQSFHGLFGDMTIAAARGDDKHRATPERCRLNDVMQSDRASRVVADNVFELGLDGFDLIRTDTSHQAVLSGLLLSLQNPDDHFCRLAFAEDDLRKSAPGLSLQIDFRSFQ